MMVSQPARAGNGRTAAENREYALIANRSRSPEQRRATAEAMWRGRRDKARLRIIDKWGPQPPDVMEELIDQDISVQMSRARAKALTMRRQARAAAERLAQAEAELAEAIAADSVA